MLALLSISVLVSGCASSWTGWTKGDSPSSQPKTVEEPAKPADSGVQLAEDYKIGPGDVLEISVYGEESLNRKDLVVRPDGKVSFPLVGDVQVGGLTTLQAKVALEQSLHEYIPEAVAAVSIVQLGSLQYYVVGKVNKPGMYNVSKPLTVLQALAMAGGLTPFAQESHIVVLRNSGKDTVRLPFNYKKIKKGQGVEENITLERGDVVVVP
jgi:polysaccharide export outer membrane protein